MRVYLGYGYLSWTTGAYWEKALEDLSEVVYVGTDKKNIPKDFAGLDIKGRLFDAHRDDCFLYVESGQKYFPKNIEKLAILSGCYLIDVHVDFSLRLEMAKFFDVVFVAQKDYLGRFREAGVKDVFWIPFGCDPEVYQAYQSPYLYDVAFVGHVAPDNRRRAHLLSLLEKRYRMNDYRKFYSPQETARVYASSKIVFNVSAYGDLNMRVFEALSCGRLLMTDAIDNGLGTLFRDKEHLILYRDEDELAKLVDYYLAHDGEREAIARRGWELVRAEHTYAHRMRQVFEILRGLSKDKECFSAVLRCASTSDVSLSRVRIYERWGLFAQLLEEWRCSETPASFFLKTFYIARALLRLLKNRLQHWVKRP